MVFLNEVDRDTRRSGRVDQVARLAELTGLTHVYYYQCYEKGQVAFLDPGTSGNAILSRYSLSDPDAVVYPKGQNVGIGNLITATITVHGQNITIGCTHFALSDVERGVQVQHLRDKLLASPHPVIFGGDLNMGPNSCVHFTTLLNAGFVKTNAVQSGTKVDTGYHLDYILYRPSNKFKVISDVILPDIASDHLAVVAVLELQNNESQ